MFGTSPVRRRPVICPYSILAMPVAYGSETRATWMPTFSSIAATAWATSECRAAADDDDGRTWDRTRDLPRVNLAPTVAASCGEPQSSRFRVGTQLLCCA